MSINDWLVIGCDVVSTVCLGLLALGSIGGTPVSFPVPVAIALWVAGKAAGTMLGHLQPIGSRRAE